MSTMRPFFRWRWPAWGLVLSLVLNGFLLGMIATDWARPHEWRRGPRVFGYELHRLSERLPDEAVRRLEAELGPRAPALEARFQRLRNTRDEINRLAAAPEPDRAAIDARLAALRGEVSAMQEDVQRQTYDALLKLPPNLRAPLATPDKD